MQAIMKGSIFAGALCASVAAAVATPHAASPRGAPRAKKNEAACQAAVAALGADKVDTRPLNETIVTVNW